MSEKTMFDSNELAALFNVPIAHVGYWVSSSKIKPILRGSRGRGHVSYFSIEEVNNFVNNNKKLPAVKRILARSA